MMPDAYRGSLGTSPTRRHWTQLSDSQGRFDSSMMESTSISLTAQLFLHSRHVLIPLGGYIPGQGTGYNTLDGRRCGKARLHCLDIDPCSLSPTQDTKHQALVLTSYIFSISLKVFVR